MSVGSCKLIHPELIHNIWSNKSNRTPRTLAFSWLLFSHWVLSDSSQCCGLYQAKLLCPPQSPRVCSSSWLIQWCYLTISSSATPFSFCLQSFPASGSFPTSRLFVSYGQSISFSSSPSNEYSGLISFRIDWFDLLAVHGILSRVFSSTKIWKHQFLSAQSSLSTNSNICTWLLKKP